MATIHDVARLAGVSIATVSRSLNGRTRVSEETRDRVIEIANALDFRPNRTARGLVTGRLDNIGVLLPDVANPFYAPILVGIGNLARERDLGVFLADTREDVKVEVELCRRLAEQVDGLVLVSARMPEDWLRVIAAAHPTVLVNRVIHGIDAVAIDGSTGMAAMIEHLAGLGHRRILYLDGPPASWSGASKLVGVRAGAASTGAEVVEVGPHSPSYAAGRAAAPAVLDSGCTAVVAYDDLVAWGVVTRVRELGASVPGDLSVGGFDDAIAEGMLTPALTTVSAGAPSMGADAAELLLRRMKRPDLPAEHRLLRSELVVRASTAAP